VLERGPSLAQMLREADRLGRSTSGARACFRSARGVPPRSVPSRVQEVERIEDRLVSRFVPRSLARAERGLQSREVRDSLDLYRRLAAISAVSTRNGNPCL